jgi:hypothetical protein
MRYIGFFLALMLCLSFAYSSTEEILLIDFTLSRDDSVSLNDMRIEIGTASEAGFGSYSLIVFSSDGNVQFSHSFDAIFTAYADPIDPNMGFPVLPGQEDMIGEYGEIGLNEIDYIVKVPFNTELSSFQIKKGDNVLYEDLIDICNNNGICEPQRGENYLSCYEDCPSGSLDNYCDGIFDNICDPDCIAQGREEMDTDCTCGNGICDPREDSFYCPEDCGKPKNPFMKGIIITAIVIIALIAGLVFIIIKLKKGKKNKKHRRTKE